MMASFESIVKTAAIAKIPVLLVKVVKLVDCNTVYRLNEALPAMNIVLGALNSIPLGKMVS